MIPVAQKPPATIEGNFEVWTSRARNQLHGIKTALHLIGELNGQTGAQTANRDRPAIRVCRKRASRLRTGCRKGQIEQLFPGRRRLDFQKIMDRKPDLTLESNQHAKIDYRKL